MAYSPNSVEGEFYEVRLYRILGSLHISDPTPIAPRGSKPGFCA